jgi:hypothetical protein
MQQESEKGMLTEHALKKKCDKFFKELKSAGRPIYYLKIHGGGVFQRAGVPDYLLVIRGRFIALELKRPGAGLDARPAQKVEMRWIRKAGGICWLEDDIDTIKAKVLRCFAGPV